MNTKPEENSSTATLETHGKTAANATGHSAWNDVEPEVSGFRKWWVPVVAGVVLTGGIGIGVRFMSKTTAVPAPKQEPFKIIATVTNTPRPNPAPTPLPVKAATPTPVIAAVDPTAEVSATKKTDDAKRPKTDAHSGENDLPPGGLIPGGPGGPLPWGVSEIDRNRSIYASKVKSRIQTRLETNPKKLKPGTNIVIHVWLDDTGRIYRARLEGSTSDVDLDAAIRDEILPGLQVSEPPPLGMPMPINMRITAQARN